MERQTRHYRYTEEELNQFNYKYDCNYKEIHKYTFWFVSMDIDDDRSETYFDNPEDAYEEYNRIKQFLQSYPPLIKLAKEANKEIVISLMCHNVFKDENGDDAFWKMNIRNEDYLEMDERDTF